MDFRPETFGALNAEDYDALHDPGTTERAVALLADLAPGADMLELAIGTGRLALPLAGRGVQVAGIEASQLMVDKLREKPGGAEIPVTIGDMANTRAPGEFDLVFLAYNTFFNLTSQAAQVACFANAAAHLRPGGRFVLETFVPDLRGFADGQRVRTMRLDEKSVWLEAATHDPLEQKFEFQRMRITDAGMKLVPLVMRYAAPPEIDLMGALAGMVLENRWGGWERQPFDAHSTMHVSVYRKPA